ncbi:MAG TPA: SNF2-related protein [Polyangium sp.]|nr:SNF2-related protein [Polyangium sp.]
MNSLLEVIRKACPSGLYTQGVNLARDGAVILEAQTPTEMTLRVRVPGVVVAPTVVLFIKDGEWGCDCGGKFDPCQHVAAAAIFAAQAPAPTPGKKKKDAKTSNVEPKTEPVKEMPARLGYLISRKAGTLFLERNVIFTDGHIEAFKGPLTTRVTKGDLPFLPSHEDLSLDRMMTTWKGNVVPTARIREVFGLLETSKTISFESKPIRVSKEAVIPVTVVQDGKDNGIYVRVDKDSTVDSVIARGVARCGDVLRPLGDMTLPGDQWERLPLERHLGREQLGQFVIKILPELEAKTRLSIVTTRLPGVGKRTPPYVDMQLFQEKHTLSVLPRLVYGNPVQARVEGKELVHVQGSIPVRDEVEERRLADKLRNELNMVFGRRVHFDGEQAHRFVQKMKDFQRGESGETFEDIFGRLKLIAKFDVQGNSFNVTFECEAMDGDEKVIRRASGDAVIRAWKDDLEIVPLDGGGFAPLPDDWLDKYGERVADLLAARAETDDQSIPPALLPTLAKLCDEIDAPKPPGLSMLVPLLDGFSGIPEAPLPEDLQATLRPYQSRGVDWLSFVRNTGLGCILADDMGLGKTLQALCSIRGRTLVVCPKTVLFNWEAEIRKFRPSLKTAMYHGPKRSLDENVDVTLTTYSMLRMDVDILSAIEWDSIVLDEAQSIKNPDSQVSKAAFTLRGKFKLTLSGTPVENRLDELWSQMHFANRGLLGGRSDFRERYALPVEGGDLNVSRRLREKIRPFVLRRMKREVAPELPPRTEHVLMVELDEHERAVYDAVRAATLPEVVKRLSEGGNVILALEALLRMRQACCHPGLVPGQTAACSSKIEALVEALSDAAADGHKALVFSQWTSLLDLVEPHLKEAGITFNRLDGSTTDRGTVVNDFQADGGPAVMLLSLKAGGVGLNLTAADHVFLLDPWWNPAVEDQAADRTHRIGQDKPVFVYRVVAKDTVEERILALQDKKRAVADAALGEAGRATSITREDLMALFS